MKKVDKMSCKSLETYEVTEHTPLMLRRIERKPQISYPTASHRTAATTGGHTPEMGDQQEDSTRYDRD